MGRADEELEPHALLQRVNMTAYCRLSDAEFAGGGGERSVSQHVEKGAVIIPIDLTVFDHGFSYSGSTVLDNFV